MIFKILFDTLFGICLIAATASDASAAFEDIKQLGAHAAIQTNKTSCVSIQTRYVALTCNFKSPTKPLEIDELLVPEQYSMSLLWGGTLLSVAQDLYDHPRDNLRLISSRMLGSAIADCRKVKQCENEVLRYFGLGDDSISFLYGLTSKKRHNNQRNEPLAKALGKQTYESDAGEFFNRFTDIGVCKKIAAEAKEAHCELQAEK